MMEISVFTTWPIPAGIAVILMINLSYAQTCTETQCQLIPNNIPLNCTITAYNDSGYSNCYDEYSRIHSCVCDGAQATLSETGITYWCGEGGNWDPDPYSIQCNDPCIIDADSEAIVMVSGEIVNRTEIVVGGIVEYACPSGSQSLGSRIVGCGENGWNDHYAFQCFASCPNPTNASSPTLTDGESIPHGYSHMFQCDHGYRPEDMIYSTCNDGKLTPVINCTQLDNTTESPTTFFPTMEITTNVLEEPTVTTASSIDDVTTIGGVTRVEASSFTATTYGTSTDLVRSSDSSPTTERDANEVTSGTVTTDKTTEEGIATSKVTTPEDITTATVSTTSPSATKTVTPELVTDKRTIELITTTDYSTKAVEEPVSTTSPSATKTVTPELVTDKRTTELITTTDYSTKAVEEPVSTTSPSTTKTVTQELTTKEYITNTYMNTTAASPILTTLSSTTKYVSPELTTDRSTTERFTSRVTTTEDVTTITTTTEEEEPVPTSTKTVTPEIITYKSTTESRVTTPEDVTTATITTTTTSTTEEELEPVSTTSLITTKTVTPELTTREYITEIITNMNTTAAAPISTTSTSTTKTVTPDIITYKSTTESRVTTPEDVTTATITTTTTSTTEELEPVSTTSPITTKTVTPEIITYKSTTEVMTSRTTILLNGTTTAKEPMTTKLPSATTTVTPEPTTERITTEVFIFTGTTPEGTMATSSSNITTLGTSSSQPSGSNVTVPPSASPLECKSGELLCQENQVCVQETNGCQCVPGLYDRLGVCIKIVAFVTTISLQETFEEALNDQSSDEFKSLEITICSLVAITIQNSDKVSVKEGFVICYVHSFSDGSVIAEVVIEFNTTSGINAMDVNDVFIDAFNLTDNSNITTEEFLLHPCSNDPVCHTDSTCEEIEGTNNYTCTCKEGYIDRSDEIIGTLCIEEVVTETLYHGRVVGLSLGVSFGVIILLICVMLLGKCALKTNMLMAMDGEKSSISLTDLPVHLMSERRLTDFVPYPGGARGHDYIDRGYPMPDYPTDGHHGDNNRVVGEAVDNVAYDFGDDERVSSTDSRLSEVDLE